MNGGIRYGGTVEIAPVNSRVNMKRVEGTENSVPEYFSNVQLDLPEEKKCALILKTQQLNTILVPLQKVFTNAVGLAAGGYWIWHGVHPTCSGHELITTEWPKQVSKRLGFLKSICI